MCRKASAPKGAGALYFQEVPSSKKRAAQPGGPFVLLAWPLLAELDGNAPVRRFLHTILGGLGQVEFTVTFAKDT